MRSWDVRAPRRKPMETVGQQKREREKEKSRGDAGTGDREGVGVPSYLVIYSPRAPGYPSRGITQGWAHRAPVVSLLRVPRRSREDREHDLFDLFGFSLSLYLYLSQTTAREILSR